MRSHKLAHLVSLLFVAVPVAAQQPAPDAKKLDKIEVTGSSIKRVQDEGALPLQIITREEIQRAGIVTLEQLLSYIPANGNNAANNLSSQTLIAPTTDIERRNSNGNSSANLRGLGAGSTLVLLNGRRVSTHGLKANAVDLNKIPIAAIERVEVLKDGASAIYGTDAIGGVINFILRRDYRGAEVTAFADMTEEGGGNMYGTSLLAGMGDLSRDRYNVMGGLAYDKQQSLGGHDRSWSNGYQPDRGLTPDTTGSPFATQTGAAGTGIGATFRLPSDPQAYNRANLLAFQGRCDLIPYQSQYNSVLWGAANAPLRYGCSWDYGGARSIIQAAERANFVGRGTYAVSSSLNAFMEVTASRSKTYKEFEPRQVTTSIAAGNVYPVGGPFYQDLSQFIATFDRTKPIAYRLRCMDCGNRAIDATSDAWRVLVGLDGSLGTTWDYKLGASYAGDKAYSDLRGGYYFTNPFNALLGSGLYNPWLLPGQTQSPAALAALQATSAAGTRLVAGKTALMQVDGAISGEPMRLLAGSLGVAAGFDYRRESYDFGSNPNAQQPIQDAPFDADFPKVTRRITAVYGELAIPVIKGLDTQLAVRHDRYSDFGGTTNPKVAFSYRPISRVMLRGSWGEGFHAPSFVQLYGPVTEGPVAGNIADPVQCPLHPGDPVYCSQRPNARSGGNPDLQPETSRQWTAGFVIEPMDWITASADAWEIKRSNRVYSLTAQQVVANYQTFPNGIVRNPDGTINYIRAGFVNASGEITRGLDVTARLRGAVMGGRWSAQLDGTYIDSYRTRIFNTDPYRELVGQWDSIAIFPRWKHTISVNYTRGPWSVTGWQRYTSHYKDEVPQGVVPPGFDPYVHAYTLHDLTLVYTGVPKLKILAGVKNVFNKHPSFTAHNVDFLSGAGWDPRVADPRDRSYQLRVTYTFR